MRYNWKQLHTFRWLRGYSVYQASVLSQDSNLVPQRLCHQLINIIALNNWATPMYRFFVNLINNYLRFLNVFCYFFHNFFNVFYPTVFYFFLFCILLIFLLIFFIIICYYVIYLFIFGVNVFLFLFLLIFCIQQILNILINENFIISFNFIS